MPKYRYVLVIKGEIEARNKTNAHLNILMGTTLSTRLIASPHEIGLELRDMETSDNGRPMKVRPFLEDSDAGD